MTAPLIVIVPLSTNEMARVFHGGNAYCVVMTEIVGP